MRRSTLLLLALALAPLAPAAAQEDVEGVLVGARIRVMAPYLTRAWIGGRMVYADSGVLIIDPTTRRWGKPLALDQAAITRVQLSRGRIGSQRNRGAVLGGVAGAAAGAYAAWAIERQESGTGTGVGGWVLIPLFAFGGTGIGAGVGAAITREGWDRVALPVQVLYEPGAPPGQ